ncbi:TPA: hypothetical protein ACV5RJ_004333 [Enterobacter roggenkampii]
MADVYQRLAFMFEAVVNSYGENEEATPEDADYTLKCLKGMAAIGFNLVSSETYNDLINMIEGIESAMANQPNQQLTLEQLDAEIAALNARNAAGEIDAEQLDSMVAALNARCPAIGAVVNNQ